MLVTSCSGAPGTVALPPRSQMLSKTLSPGPSWRSPTASSWERPAQCPDASMPAPLTLPWHLTLHRCIWAPAGSGVPPTLLLPVGSAEGARPAPDQPPTRGDPWGGWEHSLGHAASWMATCLSKAHIQALAQLGLCPLPLPPADMPAAVQRHRRLPGCPAKRVSAQTNTSTRCWQKRGPDLRMSPARLPLTPVTPQCSKICLDHGVMMKQGSSPTSLESSEPCTGGRHHPTQHPAMSKGQEPLGTADGGAEGPEPAPLRYIFPCRGGKSSRS